MAKLLKLNGFCNNLYVRDIMNEISFGNETGEREQKKIFFRIRTFRRSFIVAHPLCALFFFSYFCARLLRSSYLPSSFVSMEETCLSRRLNPWLSGRKHGERKSLPEPIFPYAVLKNRSLVPDALDRSLPRRLWRIFLPIRAHRSKRAVGFEHLARSLYRATFRMGSIRS